MGWERTKKETLKKRDKQKTKSVQNMPLEPFLIPWYKLENYLFLKYLGCNWPLGHMFKAEHRTNKIRISVNWFHDIQLIAYKQGGFSLITLWESVCLLPQVQPLVRNMTYGWRVVKKLVPQLRINKLEGATTTYIPLSLLVFVTQLGPTNSGSV